MRHNSAAYLSLITKTTCFYIFHFLIHSFAAFPSCERLIDKTRRRMREICIYTILCLFCSVTLVAQEVPFEGLHLDDLISVPGERKPGTFKSSLPSVKLPDSGILHSNKAFVPHWPRPSLPGMTPIHFPKTNNLRSTSLWKPSGKLTIRGDYFSSGSLPVETYSAYSIRSEAEASYKLTKKLSLYLSTNYISDRYHTPRSLYTRGVGGGVTYHFSNSFQLKSGVCYQYNTVFRKWEWMYLTGFVFCF